jgi:hypothetical protein
MSETVDLRGTGGAADTADVAEDTADRAEQLQTSARGWHGVQLAVLGFIGLCGALHDAGAAAGPPWVQQLAAVLVIAALVVACVATVLVAAEAWPVRAPGAAGARTRQAVGHLRLGIALTFVAVGLTALATTSSWWPSDSADDVLVTVSTSQGSLCGQLLDSSDGTVQLDLAGRVVAVPVDQVTGIEQVAGCPG